MERSTVRGRVTDLVLNSLLVVLVAVFFGVVGSMAFAVFVRGLYVLLDIVLLDVTSEIPPLILNVPGTTIGLITGIVVAVKSLNRTRSDKHSSVFTEGGPCPDCGITTVESAHYCQHCGAELTRNQAAEE